MKLTKQEKKNHNQFILSLLLQAVFIGVIIKGVRQDSFFGIIGILGIIINTLCMFLIGYSHGWELKRIDTSK